MTLARGGPGLFRSSRPTITARHKDTGVCLGGLPAFPCGNPITHLYEGKQYIVVAVGTSSAAGGAELIALALP